MLHYGSLAQFLVEQIYSTSTSITFQLSFGNIKLDPSSNITLNIYEQEYLKDKENLTKLGNIYLNYPFKECYTLEDLSPLTNHKMNFFLTVGKDTYHATLFANTLNDPNKPKKFKKNEEREEEIQKKKAPFSHTEDLLYKYTEAKSTNLPIYNDAKDLRKNIMDARSAKQWKEYQNSGFKFAKPKINFETRKKRTFLVASGYEIFDEVCDLVNTEKGFNIMEGDWFMGPFYSYDHNVKFKENGTF